MTIDEAIKYLYKIGNKQFNSKIVECALVIEKYVKEKEIK